MGAVRRLPGCVRWAASDAVGRPRLSWKRGVGGSRWLTSGGDEGWGSLELPYRLLEERINEGLMTCANMDSANDKQSKATTTTMIVNGPRQHGLGATWLGEGGSPGYREYALSDLGR